MPDFGFKDRNYIVTGGAGSIGRAIVEIIVSCGGNVTAVDLDGATLRELGSVLPEGRYRYKTADLSSPEEIRSVFAEITESYGQIHGLVNCVGVLCTAPITEVTQEEWDRVIAINLTGVFAAIQSVLPNMLSNHYGSIVNVSSVAGKLGGGLLGTSAYATSKGGINALTKVVAKTCGPQGVRCNAVCPAWTDSRMINSFMNEENIARLKQMVSLRRPATAEEAAYPIVFLLSDLASYINGEITDVDGGCTFDS